jgi:catechol 2,3-dioxygenase-like lactoylglutathione lyase family enzyme
LEVRVTTGSSRRFLAQLATLAQAQSAPGSELDGQGVPEVVGPSLDALLAFYVALGFRVERRTGPFAVVNGFGVRMFLAEDAAAPTANRWVNLRIVVPDVDAVWSCVRELGLPIAHPIGDRFYGLRDFSLKDPCGFEIRFAQVL